MGVKLTPGVKTYSFSFSIILIIRIYLFARVIIAIIARYIEFILIANYTVVRDDSGAILLISTPLRTPIATHVALLGVQVPYMQTQPTFPVHMFVARVTECILALDAVPGT